jgi:hypothetical protein
MADQQLENRLESLATQIFHKRQRAHSDKKLQTLTQRRDQIVHTISNRLEDYVNANACVYA